jgi:hypothetical protein
MAAARTAATPPKTDQFPVEKVYYLCYLKLTGDSPGELIVSPLTPSEKNLKIIDDKSSEQAR